MLRNYNGFLLDFEKRINLNLSILEEQERERGMILLDNMKKILVFEVSMMRNFEYDVTGVSNHLASIEPEKDITDMISKYRGNVPRHPNETMNRVSFMDSTLYGMIKKTFDEKIKLSVRGWLLLERRECAETPELTAERGGDEVTDEETQQPRGVHQDLQADPLLPDPYPRQDRCLIIQRVDGEGGASKLRPAYHQAHRSG